MKVRISLIRWKYPNIPFMFKTLRFYYKCRETFISAQTHSLYEYILGRERLSIMYFQGQKESKGLLDASSLSCVLGNFTFFFHCRPVLCFTHPLDIANLLDFLPGNPKYFKIILFNTIKVNEF